MARLRKIIDNQPHASQTSEFLGGEIYSFSRPSPLHQRTLVNLLAPLYERSKKSQKALGFSGPSPWILLSEVEIQINGHIIVPDICGWKKLDIPLDESELLSASSITHVPHWVCEILSPMTAALDKTRKKNIYLEVGVENYWIIDPTHFIIETYASTESLGISGSPDSLGRIWKDTGTFYGEQKLSLPPFEDVNIDLGALWVK